MNRGNLIHTPSRCRFDSRYLSQPQLVKWINDAIFNKERKEKPPKLILQKSGLIKVQKLVDLSSGVHLAYLFNRILPTNINPDKITFNPSTHLDCQRNWRNLQNQLKKANFRFQMPPNYTCFYQEPGKALQFIQILCEVYKVLQQGRQDIYKSYFLEPEQTNSRSVSKSNSRSNSRTINKSNDKYFVKKKHEGQKLKTSPFSYQKRKLQVRMQSTPQFNLPNKIDSKFEHGIQQDHHQQNLQSFATPNRATKKSEADQSKVKTRSSKTSQQKKYENLNQLAQKEVEVIDQNQPIDQQVQPIMVQTLQNQCVIQTSQHPNSSRRNTWFEVNQMFDRLSIENPQQKFERLFPQKKKEDLVQESQKVQKHPFFDNPIIKQFYSQRRCTPFCFQQENVSPKEHFKRLFGQTKLKTKVSSYCDGDGYNEKQQKKENRIEQEQQKNLEVFGKISSQQELYFCFDFKVNQNAPNDSSGSPSWNPIKLTENKASYDINGSRNSSQKTENQEKEENKSEQKQIDCIPVNNEGIAGIENQDYHQEKQKLVFQQDKNEQQQQQLDKLEKQDYQSKKKQQYSDSQKKSLQYQQQGGYASQQFFRNKRENFMKTEEVKNQAREEANRRPRHSSNDRGHIYVNLQHQRYNLILERDKQQRNFMAERKQQKPKRKPKAKEQQSKKEQKRNNRFVQDQQQQDKQPSIQNIHPSRRNPLAVFSQQKIECVSNLTLSDKKRLAKRLLQKSKRKQEILKKNKKKLSKKQKVTLSQQIMQCHRARRYIESQISMTSSRTSDLSVGS